jgi:hypothetical protein
VQRDTHRRIYTINRFNNLQTLSLLLVGEVEVSIGDGDDEDNDQRAGHASPETGLVAGSVLLSGDKSVKVTQSHGRVNEELDEPKHQTSSNTANTTKRNQRRTAEGALPLAADVVGLPAHHVRDVGVCTRASEENTCVLSRDARCPAHHGQADDGDDGVGSDDRTSDAVLIGHPRRGEHTNTGESVCKVASAKEVRIFGSL